MVVSKQVISTQLSHFVIRRLNTFDSILQGNLKMLSANHFTYVIVTFDKNDFGFIMKVHTGSIINSVLYKFLKDVSD